MKRFLFFTLFTVFAVFTSYISIKTVIPDFTVINLNCWNISKSNELPSLYKEYIDCNLVLITNRKPSQFCVFKYKPHKYEVTINTGNCARVFRSFPAHFKHQFFLQNIKTTHDCKYEDKKCISDFVSSYPTNMVYYLFNGKTIINSRPIYNN